MRRLSLAAFVTLALAGGACGRSSSSGAGELLIVVNAPFSTSPYVGTTIERGVRLAVDEINASGGIDTGTRRYRLRVETVDNGLSAQKALDNVRHAVAEHAMAVIDEGTGLAASWRPAAEARLPICVVYQGGVGLVDPVARPNVLGAGVLLVIPGLAAAAGHTAGIAPERFEPLMAAVLLMATLLVSRGGAVPGGVMGWGRTTLERFRKGRARRQARVTGRVVARLSPPAAATDRWNEGGEEWPSALEAWGPGDRPSLIGTTLRKRFGGIVALDDVSFEARGREVHALIGPNGSGKTTLLRAVSGTVPLDGGRILIGDRDISGESPQARVELGVVRTIQSLSVVPELTVLENVMVATVPRRRFGGVVRTVASTPLHRRESAGARHEALALLHMVGLGGSAEARPIQLSASDQHLLMLAAACASFPSVLMLDEPAAGMSRDEAAHLASVIGRLRARGMAVVLVEHNVGLVRRVADRVTVLAAGRVISTGTPAQVTADPAVI